MAMRSPSCAFTYDVFLNFRGIDTRYSFAGNLYKALNDKGIYTFIDNEELQRGEEITPTLLKAIEESRIAITVLSINYASSSFCLDELATILDCFQRKGMLVLPIFYNIDPSDMRHQKGGYGEALAKHEKSLKHNMDKLQKWKMALRQVADLSGYKFKHGDGYEYQFIRRIVEQVSNKIIPHDLHVADYPVGLGSQVLEVRKLLDVRSGDGVHMIGIHGIGGVGKTTLALAVYNLIADHYDGSCFLQNVREKSNKHGLQHLQSIILSELLGKKKIKLASEQQGISMIQRRLQPMKILLILDDVDKHEQLQAMAGGTDWFGSGSRVIITTRDKQLLASHEVKETYAVKELNMEDALKLLAWKAFRTEQVDPSFRKVLKRVVSYACCLPLALEVIGSNLFGKSVAEWKSAINQYERIPNDQILKTLKVDALEEEEKSVFLDISCCFKGYKLTEVEDILLAHYRHCMKYHIGVLVEKSLIKLRFWPETVTLHDLVEDMGKEIVRQESPKDSGKRSRLWLPEDIIQVLEDCTGTSKIEMICLNFRIFNNKMVEWNGMSFEKMQNLKTLIIKNGNFSQGAKYLPNSLRVLEWWGYPTHCLPSDFNPKKLSIFKLCRSSFTSFELDGLSKKFLNLRVLNFNGCACLTHIPDVSGLSNLKELSFKGCVNLIAVHDSIGFLDKLKILATSGCRKLNCFPPLKLTSLEELNCSFCSSFESFPEILGRMENIGELDLAFTPIKEFPLSFQNLIGLKYLYMHKSGIVHLPSSTVTMPALNFIDTSGCKGWKWLTQEKDEEKVGSIVSSRLDSLRAPDCNLNDDFFLNRLHAVCSCGTIKPIV